MCIGQGSEVKEFGDNQIIQCYQPMVHGLGGV